MMGRNLLMVEKFIESKGGCEASGVDLFEEFKKSNIGLHKNTLKSFTRRQFEISMKKICDKENNGVGKKVDYKYVTLEDRRTRNRKYIISGTIRITQKVPHIVVDARVSYT